MIEKELAKKTVKKKKTPEKSWPKWPSKMTPELIQKLEEAFTYGLTDDEACLSVNVSTSSFYDYQAKHPEFRKRKEELKKTPNMHAKKVWMKEITGGNYTASKEWLERKARDEFSLRHEVEQSWDLNLHVDFSTMSDDELNKYIETK